MRTLHTYFSSQDDTRSVTWAWKGEVRGLPSALHTISSNTLSQIISAPALTTITFPASPERESPYPHTYWGSNACYEAHQSVILIRTYERHNHEEEDKEKFTHIRSYAAQHSHIHEGLVYRSENVWEESMDYCRGEWHFGLTGDSLGKVYEAMGGRVAWTEPGRRLAMPEKAWKVLRSSCTPWIISICTYCILPRSSGS
jgi:hypothetical protein